MGIARALQLAGAAYDRSDYTRKAEKAVEAILTTPHDQWGVTEMGLCHGWTGVLHILQAFVDSAVGERVLTITDQIVELIVDGFTGDAEFGYRVALKDGSAGEDDPGFLDGAAGIALALDNYANGRNDNAAWDAALLIA
jgi:hypothetical protein